jgi:IS30 family transposase
MRRKLIKLNALAIMLSAHYGEAVNKLNNRPRKRYGFKTPNEVYLHKINPN